MNIRGYCEDIALNLSLLLMMINEETYTQYYDSINIVFHVKLSFFFCVYRRGIKLHFSAIVACYRIIILKKETWQKRKKRIQMTGYPKGMQRKSVAYKNHSRASYRWFIHQKPFVFTKKKCWVFHSEKSTTFSRQ